MLVIQRRAGESLLIGEEIELQILEIGHHRVRIGIMAPATIPVVRKEVMLTLAENQAAASAGSSASTVAWVARALQGLNVGSSGLTACQNFDGAATLAPANALENRRGSTDMES